MTSLDFDAFEDFPRSQFARHFTFQPASFQSNESIATLCQRYRQLTGILRIANGFAFRNGSIVAAVSQISCFRCLSFIQSEGD
jgi:hypothetical protein